MLDPEQTEAFEIHLLECPYCLELALEHDQASDLLRNNPEIRSLITELGEEAPREEETVPSDLRRTAAAPQRRRLPVLLRAMAIVAVLVAVLILKPWNIHLHPTQEVVASERRLIIWPIDNIADQTDSGKLAAVTTDLLTTDLSESRYLRVVSSQQLDDLRTLLASTGDVSTSRQTGYADVARAAGARWMLTGSIVQVEPRLVLTSQLSEVASGEVLASYRTTVDSDSDVFSLVDNLAAKIRNDLLAPLGYEDEFDPAVAEVTTRSALAYRHYLEGEGYFSRGFISEAKLSWLRAIEYDSTFAMAYHRLAHTPAADPSYLAKSVKYAKSASQRERAYILGCEAVYQGDLERAAEIVQQLVEQFPDDRLAWLALSTHVSCLGMYADAERYLKKALEIDPLYKDAHNRLAQVYRKMGKPEEALQAVSKYAELAAPGEPNAYCTKGNILASMGRLDEAVACLDTVRQTKPDLDSYNALLNLGILYTFQRDYVRARECFHEVAVKGDMGMRSTARTYLSLIPLYQGKLQEALRHLASGITVDSMEEATAGEFGSRSFKHATRGLIYSEMGESDSAVSELKQALEFVHARYPANRTAWRAHYAYFLAAAGDTTGAREVAEEIKEYIAEKGHELDGYWCVLGFAEAGSGNYSLAADYLEKVISPLWTLFQMNYLLAGAYLETGQYSEAIRKYRQILDNYSEQTRLVYGTWAVKAHYYLAQALEKTDQGAEAAEQYQTFLDIWQDADPALQPLITDARERLARLKELP